MNSAPDRRIVDRRGLGDTIESIAKVTGVSNIVKAVTNAIGIEDCGCGNRRDSLNRMFPYKTEGDVDTKTTV